MKGAGQGIDLYPVVIYLFSGREKTENEDGLVREKGGMNWKIVIFPSSVLSIPMRFQIRPPPPPHLKFFIVILSYSISEFLIATYYVIVSIYRTAFFM